MLRRTLAVLWSPRCAQALSTSQADAYLGNWWPSQQETFQPVLDSGKAEVIGTVLTGTQYAPAVPGYVTDKLGITSLADLDAHADPSLGRRFA